MATDSETAEFYRKRAAEWRAQAEQAPPDQRPGMLKIAEGCAALALIFEKSSGRSSKGG